MLIWLFHAHCRFFFSFFRKDNVKIKASIGIVGGGGNNMFIPLPTPQKKILFILTLFQW